DYLYTKMERKGEEDTALESADSRPEVTNMSDVVTLLIVELTVGHQVRVCADALRQKMLVLTGASHQGVVKRNRSARKLQRTTTNRTKGSGNVLRICKEPAANPS